METAQTVRNHIEQADPTVAGAPLVPLIEYAKNKHGEQHGHPGAAPQRRRRVKAQQCRKGEKAIHELMAQVHRVVNDERRRAAPALAHGCGDDDANRQGKQHLA